MRPFGCITSLVFTCISLACILMFMLEVNMSDHVKYYFAGALWSLKRWGEKKSMVLASLEHGHLPHFVLYFLLAKHVFMRITVYLSQHVINCFFLDILLCSYLLSFLTSWFSLKKKKRSPLHSPVYYTFPSCIYLLVNANLLVFLPPYSNTSPWPSHLAPWLWCPWEERLSNATTRGTGVWPTISLIKKTGPVY